MSQREPAPNVLFDVWRLSRRVGTLLDAALDPAGISAADFGLYSVLAVRGPLTPTELAKHSATRPTTISQALRRVERRGHLERSPNDDDARSTLVQLSSEGHDQYRRAVTPFLGTLSRVEEELGEDLDVVRTSFYRLEVALGSITGDNPPSPPQPKASSEQPEMSTEQQREVEAFTAWLRWRGRRVFEG